MKRKSHRGISMCETVSKTSGSSKDHTSEEHSDAEIDSFDDKSSSKEKSEREQWSSVF